MLTFYFLPRNESVAHTAAEMNHTESISSDDEVIVAHCRMAQRDDVLL